MASDEMEAMVSSVEDVINAHFGRFLLWTQQNWTMDAQAKADPTFKDNSDEWFDGYNAAIESLDGALACWLEEYR